MNTRQLVLLTAKVGIAGGFLWWIIDSGRLDVAQLRVFADHPSLILATVLTWLLCPLLLAGLRWWVLLAGAKLRVEFSRTLVIQHIGLFFNATVPGAIGGDVIKAIYTLRGRSRAQMAPALMSLLFDRIVGLFALFSMGTASVIARRDLLSGPAAPLAAFVLCGFVALLVVFLLIAFPVPFVDRLQNRLLASQSRWIVPCGRLVRALLVYRGKPLVIAAAWCISVLLQGTTLLLFWFIANWSLGYDVDLTTLGIVLPLGFTITALPLAPGGIGVGHAAFNELFRLLGQDGGANIFNIFFVGQLALNLSGFIPYLLLRRRGQLSSTTHTAPQPVHG